MPFDFKAYDQKCQGLTLEELQREWEHYTRLISGAATSTAVSGCAIPLTLGVSTIGVAMAAPAIHNARKKREIIERHLNRLNATHKTRKRDVLGSMAVSGTIGVVTLGVGSMGADAVATAGAEHGIQSIVANETAIKLVSHAALDGAGMMVEHKHTDHLKKKDARKAFQKAGVFQAVQDAKAAEAGYTIQPYQNNGQVYAAGSSSQALPPPPPPYNVAVGQTPVPQSYNVTPNGYPQDLKAPVAQPQAQQYQSYLTPQATGQPPIQQQYDYSQQQVPTYGAPSPMPPSNTQMFSPPQTPAVQYPPQTPQAPNTQQAQAQPLYHQQTSVPPYNPAVTPQPFNMTAMHQALPPATPAPSTPYQQPQTQQVPGMVLPTPPQDSTRAYMPQQVQPQPTGQIAGAPQAGYFPNVPATPAGYPPAVTVPQQPTPQPASLAQMPPPADPANVYQTPVQHVAQHQTGYQPSPIPAAQPQYHQQPAYTSPQVSQHTGTYQQAPAPAPAPVDRRSSFIAPHQPTYAPHAPYNPQDWAPKPQQAYTPQPPSMASPAAPAMQYQMPPTPLPTGSTVNQYQYDNKGSYFPAQPQTPQLTGQAPQQYPPANYPGAPMPNPVQVTQ